MRIRYPRRTASALARDGFSRRMPEGAQVPRSNTASRDQDPAPTVRRNREPRSMHQSVRASCAMLQKPYLSKARTSKGPRSRPSRIGEADLLETGRPEVFREEELLDALREEDRAHHEPDQDRGRMRIGREEAAEIHGLDSGSE